MSQSLSKIYLHIVFHIKYTSPTIEEEHWDRVHSYIGGLVNTTGCHVLRVGGVENHVHVLLMFSKTETVAHVVEEMKRNSSRWIKTISPKYENFAWQGGYGAFSVSQSVAPSGRIVLPRDYSSQFPRTLPWANGSLPLRGANYP